LGIALAFTFAAPAALASETPRGEAGCSAHLQTAAVDDGEGAPVAQPRKARPVPKAQKRGTASEPAKKVASAKAMQAEAAAKFYRYPMMYRGEAPPRMPPGVEQHLAGAAQPYVQAGPGVWYWPGADSIKIPRVPGFDPQIEASKVIQW
jgi:hypothetical protein